MTTSGNPMMKLTGPKSIDSVLKETRSARSPTKLHEMLLVKLRVLIFMFLRCSNPLPLFARLVAYKNVQVPRDHGQSQVIFGDVKLRLV
jgi:hypothetical protein